MPRTDLSLKRVLRLIGIHKSKYFRWKEHLDHANHHNHAFPKASQITPEERSIVLDYARKHYLANDYFLKDGYRRIAYRMMDEGIAWISPSSVYRILKDEGLLNEWKTAKKSKKGSGFHQPTSVHEHWHTDIKYVSFRGTFLFLITVIDGYSRFIMHHELRTSMDTGDVALTITSSDALVSVCVRAENRLRWQNNPGRSIGGNKPRNQVCIEDRTNFLATEHSSKGDHSQNLLLMNASRKQYARKKD